MAEPLGSGSVVAPAATAAAGAEPPLRPNEEYARIARQHSQGSHGGRLCLRADRPDRRNGQAEPAEDHFGAHLALERAQGRPGRRLRRARRPCRLPGQGPLTSQPATKLSRTRRRGLSEFRSTRTMLCHVPSSIWPAWTGTVTDGPTSAGRTWSAPWPGEPWRWR